MNIIKTIGVAAATLYCSIALAAPADAVNQIKTSAQEVLRILNKDNGSNSAAVRAEAEKYAVPHFDFRRMTAHAVGQPWKQATPEQQKALAEAFKNKLIRIYSGTMLQYKTAKVTVNNTPVVSGSKSQIVTVKTEVLPNANASKKDLVHIDYTTYETNNTYRIYDVVVEGQSLVTVYRNQFKEIVQQKGIDGLIQELKQGK